MIELITVLPTQITSTNKKLKVRWTLYVEYGFQDISDWLLNMNSSLDLHQHRYVFRKTLKTFCIAISFKVHIIFLLTSLITKEIVVMPLFLMVEHIALPFCVDLLLWNLLVIYKTLSWLYLRHQLKFLFCVNTKRMHHILSQSDL